MGEISLTQANGRVAAPHGGWLGALPMPVAISLGLAAADPSCAGTIRAAQVNGVVRLTPLAMGASCANAIILLFALGRAGALRASFVLWCGALFAVAVYHLVGWARRRGRPMPRTASVRTINRAILHGTLFGMLWGSVPVMTFPAAPVPIQLVIGCLTAGMMCAGGFVLATVPAAGCAYVAAILVGATWALLAADAHAIHLSLLALMVVYAGVVVTNLTWNAGLFVDHLLIEARLQTEILAREQAQAEVAHAQRMTALGELAGGIAHDVNNILQGVAGSTTLIARHADEPERVRDLAARVLQTTERGGAITRRLLGFARQDMLSAEPLDAGRLLQAVAELLCDSFGSRIQVRVEVGAGLPMLLADKAQLEVIIVNLATNARDAMTPGGVLTLRAVAETVSPGRHAPPLRQGNYIRLSSTDTGTGMDEATLARATEPFFSTKPKGVGTGLGLSMAKGFAEQSGGALSICSVVGYGTTVNLWLPQAAPAAAAPAPQPVHTRMFPPRHVLLVEDDVHVRETMMLSLAGAGFVMSGAVDAPHALQHIDGGARVDALVTDFLMPGLNGVELIRAARLRKPGLIAIMLTGHMGDVEVFDDDTAASDSPFILLQKPMSPDQLAERLALALGSFWPGSNRGSAAKPLALDREAS